uniref:Variant surface glycoprotein 1125.5695 n=1 Tax=Trypanosoma brucei TaxID=5691 RepID=M4SXS2_9TRYP|nr:variant surface glycoprotein 1981 [Trypanosoma brucei]APD75737.1 variant surface glycoprotein 1125.5695 [Trypanosoma brucei]
MKQTSQVLLIFIATVTDFKMATSSHLHDTTKHITTACDVTNHLTELAKQLKNKVKAQVTQLQQGRAKIAQLGAAQAMSATEDMKLFGPVLALAAELQAEGESQLSENLGTIIDGIHALAELAAAENIVNEAAKIEIPTTAQMALGSFLTASQCKQIRGNISSGSKLGYHTKAFGDRSVDNCRNKFNSTTTISLFFFNDRSVTPGDDPRICSSKDDYEVVCEDTRNIETATQMGIKGGSITKLAQGLIARTTDGSDEYTPTA